jgi:hypothetical protein
MLSRRGRFTAGLLTCWIVAFAVGDTPVKPGMPTTGPAPSKEVETDWYDIRDLVHYWNPDSRNAAEGQERANQLDQVKQLIISQVDANTWKDNGGDVGTISFYGTALIISQTASAQLQIKALLEKLRLIHAPHGPIVTIDAYWLRLTPSQLPAGEDKIAAELLNDQKALYAKGRLAGFEGATANTSATRSASYVSGATPVVAPGVAIYEPQLSSKQTDVTLSETPTEMNDGSLAVSFESKVTMDLDGAAATPTTRPATEPSQLVSPLVINAAGEAVGSAQTVMQIQSVIRLKVGVPTVVSGISVQPGAPDNRTLYLVLCATVAPTK